MYERPKLYINQFEFDAFKKLWLHLGRPEEGFDKWAKECVEVIDSFA